MNMKLKYRIYFALALLLTFLGTKAQLQVSTNGRFLNVNGLKIYFEETGRGTPLLLLHGFGRSNEDWKPYIKELSKSNRVIAIDLPGHCRSDLMDTSDEYLHKQAANQIITFINLLKLDTVNIIGFSSGAMIGLHIITLKPTLVNKIILVSGQTSFSDSTRKFISALGGPNNFIMDTNELTEIHGKKKAAVIAKQFWNFRKLYGDPSFTPDELKTIKTQTLVIHGDSDPIAPVENALSMFKFIPNAHLWIIPYGEHISIFLPDHQNEFLQKTLLFLKNK
jgi:pimeloyl-ACP methyl ester carboxylesterase